MSRVWKCTFLFPVVRQLIQPLVKRVPCRVVQHVVIIYSSCCRLGYSWSVHQFGTARRGPRERLLVVCSCELTFALIPRKCSSSICNRFQPSTTKTSLLMLPRYLLIHLKRFESIEGTNITQKVKTHVQFPVRGLIVPIMAVDVTYNLIGVVVRLFLGFIILSYS